MKFIQLCRRLVLLKDVKNLDYFARRAEWKEGKYLGLFYGRVCITGEAYPDSLKIEDYLADDWEILSFDERIKLKIRKEVESYYEALDSVLEVYEDETRRKTVTDAVQKEYAEWRKKLVEHGFGGIVESYEKSFTENEKKDG